MKLHPILLALGVLVVGNCQSPNSSKTTDLSAEEQQKLDEYKAELEIGRNMAGRLLQFYGVYEDTNLINYVNQVGLYVSKFGEDPNRRYMFEILDTENVNAFACPGGYILVTLGAIKHARNEAQLAHVLGHEVTHVAKKHMFETLKTMSKEEMNKVAEEAEKAHANLSEAETARQRPDPETSELGSLVARYLSGSAAGLSIIQAAKAGMSLILEKGLDAKLEFEADKFGVDSAIKAGYEPAALIDFLCRIKEGNKKGRCILTETAKKSDSILDKTHPPIPERIKAIKLVLKDAEAKNIVGAKGTARFKKYLEPVFKKHGQTLETE
ncbi:MAG: M48 family metalloprotease [Oligoflexales bacterium]